MPAEVRRCHSYMQKHLVHLPKHGQDGISFPKAQCVVVFRNTYFATMVRRWVRWSPMCLLWLRQHINHSKHQKTVTSHVSSQGKVGRARRKQQNLSFSTCVRLPAMSALGWSSRFSKPTPSWKLSVMYLTLQH